MEFEDDDHEQEEEEEEEDDDDDDEGTTIPPSAPSAAATTSLAVPHTSTGASRYRECQKNHAVSIGGHAVDGCGEFMPAGEDGTLNALKCAACGCHRNFHRKETDSSSAAPSPDLAGAAASSSAAAAAAAAFYQPQFPHHPAYYRATPAPPPPGYLQHPHRPLALPSTTPEMEELSNPSSSGGGKKRFRTKFTAEQKERMVEFAERIGWRITKQDEAAVEQFCSELRLSRQVLKVWLHNNKHTLGRKP